MWVLVFTLYYLNYLSLLQNILLLQPHITELNVKSSAPPLLLLLQVPSAANSIDLDPFCPSDCPSLTHQHGQVPGPSTSAAPIVSDSQHKSSLPIIHLGSCSVTYLFPPPQSYSLPIAARPIITTPAPLSHHLIRLNYLSCLEDGNYQKAFSILLSHPDVFRLWIQEEKEVIKKVCD